MLRWILVALFSSFVAMLLFAFSNATADALYRERRLPLELLGPQLVTRKAAPDFSLPDRRGRILRLSSLKGRPVVLNLWSSDCPPCREELPSLITLDRIARSRGTFSVLTVTIDQRWEDVQSLFPEKLRSSLVVLFDPERGVVEGRYGTTKFPETFLIDGQGSLRARFDGQRSWDSPVVLNLLENL